MADPQLVTQEEMALRRRARRRLVGAVAIALAAVVLLPMLFDPEPKPLGSDVDLRIPSKDSPFESAPAAPPATPEPPPQAAEPTLPPVVPSAVPEAVPPQAPSPSVVETPVPRAAEKPIQPATAVNPPPSPGTPAKVETKPKIEDKADGKPESKPEAKQPAKQPAKPEPKSEAKPAAKAEPVQGNKGYILQLGAFGSEANARQLQDKAQAAGFKAGISSANGQFRVRIGPMPEHDKALEIQNRLKAKGFNPVLMGP